jgi:hypothetical protein
MPRSGHTSRRVPFALEDLEAVSLDALAARELHALALPVELARSSRRWLNMAPAPRPAHRASSSGGSSYASSSARISR